MKRLDERINEARENLAELRKGTQELSQGFAETDRQLYSSKRMFQALDKQAAERLQRLDEMIYLNRLINHLETASQQMILVPVHVTREKLNGY
ncbi:hypothetical protein CHS0354_017263 [Potamilus streckersoni]|uniref:Uncharacterized protein n=1 Tax=Potamilus streckersoni TaxID=2493646 RepID=A0AAE0VLM6_9BIVA|nr:hypothetical protein CHS0354_017263 [Potamilus streckersoni]